MRVFTLIGGFIGLALTLVAVFGNGSAPQQAAMAGIALCAAVIPYVLFRVQQIGQQAELEKTRHQEVLNALRERETA